MSRGAIETAANNFAVSPLGARVALSDRNERTMPGSERQPHSSRFESRNDAAPSAGSWRIAAPIRRKDVVSVHLAEPVDADEFEEFLYSIDHLPKSPGVEFSSPAGIAEIPHHVLGLVIFQATTGMGCHILLGRAHDPTVEWLLDA